MSNRISRTFREMPTVRARRRTADSGLAREHPHRPRSRVFRFLRDVFRSRDTFQAFLTARVGSRRAQSGAFRESGY